LNVIIPTKNSEDTLEICLISLRKQTMPVNIIIIDGCSTDKTIEIAKKYGCSVYDEPKSLGRGSKRAIACNLGLLHAKAIVPDILDLVAFLDSDVEVPETWAFDMVNHPLLKNLKVAGITSGCEPDTSTELSRSINTVMKIASTHAQKFSEVTPLLSIPGYNSIYRLGAISIVGGFDETIGGAEDWELNSRLRRVGYLLFGVPESPVIHHERKNIHNFMKQIWGYGWSWGRLFRVKGVFKFSRALPSLALTFIFTIIISAYFYDILRIPAVLFLLGLMVSFFMIEWEFSNKYYTLLRVFVVMQLSLAVGYIKGLFA
jgi:glycosyltransferase involved in cell wall biosynthesis